MSKKLVAGLTCYDRKIEVLLDTETGKFSHNVHRNGAVLSCAYMGHAATVQLFNDIVQLAQKAGIDMV